MPIGTSLGGYYSTEAEFHMSPFMPSGDPSVLSPDTNVMKDSIESDAEEFEMKRNVLDPARPIKASDTTPAPDYDYDSWKKANPDAEMAPGQHYPDTYKLPNHITFSDESMYHGKDGARGGSWTKLEGDPNNDYDWSFTPGKTNLENHSINELKDYFAKREPRSILDLSGVDLQ